MLNLYIDNGIHRIFPAEKNNTVDFEPIIEAVQSFRKPISDKKTNPGKKDYCKKSRQKRVVGAPDMTNERIYK